MPSILPAGTSSIDEKTTEVWIPNQGTTTTVTNTGTAAEIATLFATLQSGTNATFGSKIASATMEKANGRGTLSTQYVRSGERSILVETDEDGTQELYGFDVVKDIMTAEYFKALSPADKAECRELWEDRTATPPDGWATAKKVLFYHLQNGVETYTDTAYEFRRTFTTSSSETLKKSASDPNTVVLTALLPPLSSAMKNLIDALPTGEWLKKPITVTYAGKSGWVVCESWQWSWKWSVVYSGGTWTGEAVTP